MQKEDKRQQWLESLQMMLNELHMKIKKILG